jgi:hypothetical protein
VLAAGLSGGATAFVVTRGDDDPPRAERVTETRSVAEPPAPRRAASEPRSEPETYEEEPATTAESAPAEEAADPDLERLAAHVGQTKGFSDQADVVTFALLYHHLETGTPILTSVAMGSIDGARGDLYRYRVAGYLDFWQNRYGGVDWQRFPIDEQRMLGMYDTYTYSQVAARQNRINQRLGAIVGSEEAWHQVMSDVRARDEQAATQQYVSDLRYEAERSVQRAQTAIAGG